MAAVFILPAILATAAPSPMQAAAPAAPPTPFALAVTPFEDLRSPGQEAWLGRFLRESIAKSFLRVPQISVLGLDAAAQWQHKLGLRGTDAVEAESLHRMGIDVLILGSTQRVLRLAEIKLRVVSARGDLLPETVHLLRADLAGGSPGALQGRVLQVLHRLLAPAAMPALPPPPERWGEVESLFTALGEAPPPGDRSARPALIARLRPLSDDLALGGRAHEALALLHLEQALLHAQSPARRHALLAQALEHAATALGADRRDTERQALKGEIHYFLKQDEEAKAHASIARIKNPLNGLAFIVLGLVAGLSTGESVEQFKRAFAVHPYLRRASRPIGSSPFQSGILEPYFQKWEQLHASRITWNGGDPLPANYENLLTEGIAHFELQQWDAAEPLLQQAAELEEGDHRPWLYLYRLLIETGRAGEAVQLLRQLSAENPQQADILHYLGVALQSGGEHAQAREAFRKALVERPNDPRSVYHLATADIALGRWEDARGSLRTLLHEQPEHALGWLQMGIVQAQLKDWEAAEGALERALAIDPNLPDAQRRLERLRRRPQR